MNVANCANLIISPRAVLPEFNKLQLEERFKDALIEERIRPKRRKVTCIRTHLEWSNLSAATAVAFVRRWRASLGTATASSTGSSGRARTTAEGRYPALATPPVA